MLYYSVLVSFGTCYKFRNELTMSTEVPLSLFIYMGLISRIQEKPPKTQEKEK